MRWDDVGEFRPQDLALDLRRYVELDHPIYPTEDPHCVALHRFLFERAPDPAAFLPLFGPHGRPDVDDVVLRRDVIASTVATSFMRRIVERPDDPYRAAMYDVLAFIGVNFAFDPVYGEAHTETSTDVGDFFGEPGIPPCPESAAALQHHLPALLAAWRGRVTRKGTSSFFGILLRHLGAAVAATLVREWEGLDEDERVDLVLRLGDQEGLPVEARLALVRAVLDRSYEVREAALRALEAQGAPVGEVDPSESDEALDLALRPARQWARKTNS